MTKQIKVATDAKRSRYKWNAEDLVILKRLVRGDGLRQGVQLFKQLKNIPSLSESAITTAYHKYINKSSRNYSSKFFPDNVNITPAKKEVSKTPIETKCSEAVHIVFDFSMLGILKFKTTNNSLTIEFPENHQAFIKFVKANHG